ncbi:MAG: GNAT family N-acetyltransferase, partial [Pseudobdellovibrionaceae bacterium]
LQFEVGSFVLKTITEKHELIDALRLRYEVFHEEFIGVNAPSPFAIDVDEFDSVCDHLAIIDKKKNIIVGTYRMNSTAFNDHFYSATEFRLDRILDKPGVKVELGRACIRKEYRKGVVIALLWKGIAEYMKAVGAQFFFGCGSVKTESPRVSALLYTYFREKGHISDIHWCPPTRAYKMPAIDAWIHEFKRPLTAEETTEAEAAIPSLFKGYLKAGAVICGEPAYDVEFKCIDFLTLLDRSGLNETHSRKFGLE